VITKDVPTKFFDTDVLAIDVETTGLDPLRDRVLLISLSNGRRTIVSDTKTWLPHLWKALRRPDTVTIAHNAAFDLRFLWQLGFNGYPTAIWDTLLVEQLLTAGTFVKCDLEQTAFRRVGKMLDKILRKTFVGFLGDEFTPRQIQYAHDDVNYLISIMETQATLCRTQNLLEAAKLENQLVPVTAKMEHVGVGFDVDAWRTLVERERRYTSTISQEIQRALQLETYSYNLLDSTLGGINLNSNDQVRLSLDQIGINVPNMQETTLLKHVASHPDAVILEKFLQYRKRIKQIGFGYDKYIDPSTGRIHSHYRQLGAVSGRYSSSGPNLQNVPIRTELGKQIRRCFIAQLRWKLIQADYSQQEMRILAQASGDENLIDVCRHGDPHGENARRLYGDDYTKDQRRIAKGVTFGMSYGAAAKRIAQAAGIPLQEAEELVEYTLRTHPDVAKYATKLIIFADEHGYVTTLGGRRRYFQRTSDNRETFWDNEIRNHPIQGTAVDMIKRAMIGVDEALCDGNYRARIVLQIHDELIVEAPDEEVLAVKSIVVEEMEKAGKYYVQCVPTPVDVSVETYWKKE